MSFARNSFNPRPHAGDDLLLLSSGIGICSFNPRPHAGDDRDIETLVSMWRPFNPRPHAGDDFAASLPSRNPCPFQPTSPRGGRRKRPGLSQIGTNFQPTSPRGGRQHKSPKTAQLFIRLSHIFSSLYQTNHKESYSPVPLCTPVPSIMKFSRCEGTVQIM